MVIFLTQGLRRAAQDPGPNEESTVFRDRRRTWSETADRVARISGGLKAAGVQSGDRIAILALNSDRYFELLYAIPWLGGVMVPVNTRLATPEVQYVLEDSGSQLLFVDGAMTAHAAALAGESPTVEAVIYLDDDHQPRACGPTRSSRRHRQSKTPEPVATCWPACSIPGARRASPRV